MAGFLKRYRATVIAAAYESQRLPLVKTDGHDRRMDAVVTEKAIY